MSGARETASAVTLADDPADSDQAAGKRLGAHIRQLRQRRGLTLVRLAEATDLSHPFLSQLERGLAQPSLSSLRRIAVALETSPIELIAAADAPDGDAVAVEVHRHGEIAVDASFAAGSARMLAHGARPLHPMEVSGDNAEPGEVFAHGDDEFLYVLAGEVRVELDGTERTLHRGDSAYYAGGVTHRWWSVDGAAYRLIVVKQGHGSPRWENP
jgi:transcriptional regulator with XRE-family HTH domain